MRVADVKIGESYTGRYINKVTVLDAPVYNKSSGRNDGVKIALKNHVGVTVEKIMSARDLTMTWAEHEAAMKQQRESEALAKIMREDRYARRAEKARRIERILEAQGVAERTSYTYRGEVIKAMEAVGYVFSDETGRRGYTPSRFDAGAYVGDGKVAEGLVDQLLAAITEAQA